MSMNVSVGVIKTGDFAAHNRLEFRDWNTQQKNPQAMFQRMDRYFYLEYSQRNLESIEKARVSRQTSRRSTFLKLSQKLAEDQFVTEYLGVDGYTNKMSGHRERMTKKIHSVYEKIIGKRLGRGESPSRIEVDQTILQSPFGGLEVAFQLVQYIQQQRELSLSGREIISDKLIQTYDNEILKWVWYWTISSHVANDKNHFDLFKVITDRHKISGDFGSKLGRVITYIDRIKDERYKQLLRWHLIAYISSALDILLTEGDKSQKSDEKMKESKEMLKMMTKPLLDKLESKELRKANLTKREEQIILVLYHFHTARVPQTLGYYQKNNREFDLSWQMLIMPDHILFNVLSQLEDGRKKRIRKIIADIHKSLNNLTAQDRQLASKLDSKVSLTKAVEKKPIKGIGKSEVAKTAEKKKSSVQLIEEEIEKNKGCQDDVKINQILESSKGDLEIRDKIDSLKSKIDKPFIVGIKNEADSIKVVCATLQQVLHIGDRKLFDKMKEFLEVTRQSDIPPDLQEIMWSQRKGELKEKGSITPLQKIHLEEVAREIEASKDLDWDLVIKAFDVNFGSCAQVVSESQDLVSHLLSIKITKPPKESKLLDFLNLSYGKLEQVLNKMLEVGLLKTPHEKSIIITCWNVLYLW